MRLRLLYRSFSFQFNTGVLQYSEYIARFYMFAMSHTSTFRNMKYVVTEEGNIILIFCVRKFGPGTLQVA